MPLKKADILKMGKILGMDNAKLKEAIDATDEVDVEIPDVKVLTPDGLKKLEKDKYEDGKVAGVEMAVKEYKTENNISFEGKDLKALVTHVQSQTDTDGRVTKLQKTLEKEQQRAEQAEARALRVEASQTIHNAIGGEYAGLKKHELQAIAEASGFEFKMEKGKVVPYRNGERVRDERTQTDVELGAALKNFFETERGMTAGAPPGDDGKGGRGGKDGKPGGTSGQQRKRSEIEKEWTTANPGGNVNGMDYNAHFQKIATEEAKAGREVVMD